MILTLLCLASIWSNILCFNFALICIDSKLDVINLNTTTTNQIENDSTLNNITNKDEINQMFTSRERLYLTSAVAASALITNFIVVTYVIIILL